MSQTVRIPKNFRYREVFLKGRPVHDKHSSFYAKHPPMPPSRWAKIFSPFDALRGFSDAVSSKNILYEYRRIPDEDTRRELDRKLEILKFLTRNGRAAKAACVTVSVTYYQPCTDRDNDAYGYKGRYIKKSGVVRRVDTELERIIQIDDAEIDLEDISAIDADLDPEATVQTDADFISDTAGSCRAPSTELLPDYSGAIRQ